MELKKAAQRRLTLLTWLSRQRRDPATRRPCASPHYCSQAGNPFRNDFLSTSYPWRLFSFILNPPCCFYYYSKSRTIWYQAQE